LRSPPFYCTSLDGELALDPLELEGELALGLDELVLPELAPLEDPLDAEPDESLTPKAASVCRSS